MSLLTSDPTDLGDYTEDETVHFIWHTHDSAGASVTRTTDGTVSVYKDNGTTQSTAGITDTEDFDMLTGIHVCTIDLSADAFYAIGANYSVVLSAATIDSQTVNAVLAHFSIENRFAEVDVTKMVGGTVPTPATTGIPDVNVREWLDNGVASGTAGIPNVNMEEVDGNSDAPIIIRLAYANVHLADVAAVAGAVITLSTVVNTLSTTNDVYNGCLCVLVEASGSDARPDQVRTIIDWDGAALDATLDSAFTAVSVSDRVLIWAYGANTHVDANGRVDVGSWLGAAPNALVSGRVDATVDATGMETGAVDNILTTQMTESYAANGTAPTMAQAQFAIHQMLMDFSISGTTITVEQLDGTTAFLVTLDDGTNPASANRA